MFHCFYLSHKLWFSPGHCRFRAGGSALPTAQMFGKGEGGNLHNPTRAKKAVAFKPPLRSPAPGASPLCKINQPGVCFLSAPAPRLPGDRGAQPDTAAPVPREGLWWHQPHGDPVPRAHPVATCVGFSCLFALREAAGAAVELFLL